MKKEQKADELRLALVSWRESLKRYDLAEPDEAGYAALETEAALRRYTCLLNRRRRLFKKCGL